MQKSLRRATLSALFILMAVPSVASAAFTPTLTNVATVEPGCAPKAKPRS